MAVTHPVAVRNSITDFIVDKLDVGAGSNGSLEFQNSGSTDLCTNLLATTAFGASAAGIATAAAIANGTVDVAGTCDRAELRDQDVAVVILMSVGTSGQDINLSSVVFAINDEVQITSLTYEGPN